MWMLYVFSCGSATFWQTGYGRPKAQVMYVKLSNISYSFVNCLPGNHRGFSRPEWFISLTPLSACAFGENNQGSALPQIAHGV